MIPLEELDRMRPADLLFFGEGETIKHVAIFTGGRRFIHAYGSVRINSLDRTDPLYEAKLAESVLFGRAIIN
jgi:cell wall-associated NlpC family hydrolase